MLLLCGIGFLIASLVFAADNSFLKGSWVRNGDKVEKFGLSACVVPNNQSGKEVCSTELVNTWPAPPLLSFEKKAKRNPCYDITKYNRIIDFHCNHTYPNAHYHQIRDCLLPAFNAIELALQSKQSTTYLIVPWYMDKYLDMFNIRFFNRTTTSVMHTQDQNQICLQVSAGTYIYRTALDYNVSGSFRSLNYVLDKLVERASKLTQPQQQQNCAQKSITGKRKEGCLKSRAKVGNSIALINGDNKKDRKIAVFIYRMIDRMLSYEVYNAIHSVLRVSGDWQVYYYNGNETVAQTVYLFSSASFIFGFHGAGLVNAFFCKKPSVVVFEVSYYVEQEGHIWRLNSWEYTYSKKMIVVPYALNFDAELANKGEVMKNAKNVRVDPAHLYNMQQYVRLALVIQAYAWRYPGLSLPPSMLNPHENIDRRGSYDNFDSKVKQISPEEQSDAVASSSSSSSSPTADDLKLAMFLYPTDTTALPHEVFEAIHSVLRADGDWRVRYYNSSETIADAHHLFSAARFVVGFNGAGFVNAIGIMKALACKKPAVVVFEISFSIDDKEDRSRTNTSSMILMSYVVRSKRASPQSNQYTSIERADIYNMQQYVQLALSRQQFAIRNSGRANATHSGCKHFNLLSTNTSEMITIEKGEYNAKCVNTLQV